MSQQKNTLNIDLERFHPSIRHEVAANIKSAETLLNGVDLISAVFNRITQGVMSLKGGRLKARST